MRYLHLAIVALMTIGTGFQARDAQAAVVDIVGIQTDVEVTIDLEALGLMGAPFGNASLDESSGNSVFTFPITGGSLDNETGQAVIQHEGSGVTISNGFSITVGNFLIDTAQEIVIGDVAGGTQDVVFFNFGTVDEMGVQLLISQELAEEFGVALLENVEFGFAESNLQAVPIPAALPLFVSALTGLVALHRRRRLCA